MRRDIEKRIERLENEIGTDDGPPKPWMEIVDLPNEYWFVDNPWRTYLERSEQE